MTVGWGIIGIGALADTAIAPAITRQGDSELVAVTSRSLERAERFAGRHHATRAYDDFAAMLADDAVDVVYVATPNGLHAEHTLAALDAGKHVLVDKPMALSIEDGRAMIAAAHAAGLKLGVGFQLRHKEANLAGRDAISEGAIGRPVLFELSVGAGRDLYPYDTWRADGALAGGGTLLNQGTHAIDLAQFLAGSPIVEVSALADSDSIEDVSAAACRLANGALVTIASHQVIGGPPRNWVAVGQDGWLEGRGATGGGAGDRVVLNVKGEEATVLASSSRSAYEAEIDAFARAATGAEEVNGSGQDGLRVIAVSEALYRSARTGRTVEVEQV
jgi:1,5-anhydro-D-fructose reductase (1,5-anhydro-D-mannitol-forming)